MKAAVRFSLNGQMFVTGVKGGCTIQPDGCDAFSLPVDLISRHFGTRFRSYGATIDGIQTHVTPL